MKTTILLTIIFSSLSLHAETNYMTVIGGGGEPVNALITQFDTGILNFSVFYNQNKSSYKTTINFNGGHRQTESIINENFKGASIKNGFNQQSFESIVNDYIKKLTANPPEIKAGEKIMLFISDHGGESAGNTHKISSSSSAMTNINSGSSDGMISLDNLATLSKAAKDANVKLAIVDASCHSGNSLSLANDKTCVITASGPKHYGFSSFAEVFANNMGKGKNLEDIFLSTRDTLKGEGFPEISTPEGTVVQDEIYPLLTPYMFYHDEYRGMELDKIDTYLKSTAIDGAANYCARQNEYVQLTTLLTLIEDINSIERKSWFSKKITKEKTVDLSDLKKKIAEYRDVQENYIKRLQEISRPDLEKREPMNTPMGQTIGYTHKELLDGNWDYSIREKEKDLLDNNLTAGKRKELEDSRDYYKVSRETKEKVMREHPEYQRYQNILNELKTNTKVSRAIGSSISIEAHKAYSAYYKNQQKIRTDNDKNASNACKDFVL
ncbi:MAG: hypothetical protein H7336_02075 [Bacteriovorax sp.]|nr:hypothetical protein [Bacteriovorax sp.]